MLNQHWVGFLFESFVRLVAAARFARAGAQPMTASAFVVALGAVHLSPMALHHELGSLASLEPRVADTTEALEAADVPILLSAPAQAPAPAPAQAQRHAPRGPQLSAEQQNIARFIADKYRLAIDQTQQFVEYAYRTAREVKVDPWLILAVVSVESNFNPTAQSQQGAQGLMQVLTRVHADKFQPFGGVAAAFDPLANMRVGARILKDYLARDGSVEGALKAYVGAALLPHDGGYGAKVLSERERIAAAAAGMLRTAANGVPAAAPSKPARAPEPSAAIEPAGASLVQPADLRVLASGEPMPAYVPQGAAEAGAAYRATTGI
jgi:soluble lytic murein transglycosylase-like protein